MKAIHIIKNGGPEVLQIQEMPQPKPAAGQALVRLKAAGLNYIDVYMRAGTRPTSLPYVPGFEGAGIVEAVSADVTEVKPGDRVAYTGQLGSYAEFNVVKASQLIPLPQDISFEQGAAFPLQGMTAHYLVHDYYHVKAGDHVLVHAAAGGVGLLLVQWLKHLGATVIGTVSTEEKGAIAREAGADHVIFYNTQDFVAESKKITSDEGVDYIIDGVGKSTFTKDLEAARTGGHICIFGMSSGPAEPLHPNALQVKSLTVSGGNLFNSIHSGEDLHRCARDVLQGIREGWLKLRIDHVFPLQQASEAHRVLEGRKTMGKVILKISD